MLNSEEILKKAYASLLQKNTFKKGDIVQWKERLKNRRWPGYSQPAIVVELLETPFSDEKEQANSPYFKEPLDIVLGFLDTENNFVTFYFDSRKFEPFKQTS